MATTRPSAGSIRLENDAEAAAAQQFRDLVGSQTAQRSRGVRRCEEVERVIALDPRLMRRPDRRSRP